MKLKELRELDTVKLQAELATLRGKLRDMRFGLANRQIKNIREVRALKKQIAQILTVVRSRTHTTQTK